MLALAAPLPISFYGFVFPLRDIPFHVGAAATTVKRGVLGGGSKAASCLRPLCEAAQAAPCRRKSRAMFREEFVTRADFGTLLCHLKVTILLSVLPWMLLGEACSAR